MPGELPALACVCVSTLRSINTTASLRWNGTSPASKWCRTAAACAALLCGLACALPSLGTSAPRAPVMLRAHPPQGARRSLHRRSCPRFVQRRLPGAELRLLQLLGLFSSRLPLGARSQRCCACAAARWLRPCPSQASRVLAQRPRVRPVLLADAGVELRCAVGVPPCSPFLACDGALPELVGRVVV